MPAERLQKILAKAGICSRRQAEELISQGLVTVNGKVAKLGDKAELGAGGSGDAIKVKGKLLQGAEAKMYLALYKPKGVISMLVDNERRPTLSIFLEKLRTRVFPVGRLDFNSEGLILLTNDGDFAEKLQRRDDIPRVYTAKLRGHLNEEMVKRLSKGARLERRTIRPHSVRIKRELESKSEVELVMMGSGAVDIKSMIEMKGFLVERITRTAIGHITLKGLVPGHYRLLKADQALALLERPELGLQRLERELLEEKTGGGQRKFHEKKATAEEAAASQAEASAQKAARILREGARQETRTAPRASAKRPQTAASKRSPGSRPRGTPSGAGGRTRAAAPKRPRAF